MFKKLNIGIKITALVLSVVLIALATVSFITYSLSNKAIEEKYIGILSSISAHKATKIETQFERVKEHVQLIGGLESLHKAFEADTADFAEYTDNFQDLKSSLRQITNNFHYDQAFIYDEIGTLVIEVKNDNYQISNKSLEELDAAFISKSSKDFSVSILPGSNKIFFGSPLPSKMGSIVFKMSADPINKILQDSTGLGNTGESILLGSKGNDVFYLSPVKTIEGNISLTGTKSHYTLEQVHPNNQGLSFVPDYKKDNTLSYWKSIPQSNWSLLTKIDQKEVRADLDGLWLQYAYAAGIIALLSFLITLVFSKFLTGPLMSLKTTVKMLGEGILPEKVEKSSHDEIGQIAETMDNLVQGLKRTANFAHKIGEGDFDADYKPMSDHDALGTALINMRNSIQEAEKQDKERNWIVIGVAEIGEILRSHNDLVELGDAVTAYVVQKINAVQGAFYVVNDDDEDDVFIEMKSSFAYNKKKYLNAKFKFAQGLVGQSAIEQDTLLRTEIPDDYMNITSGLLGEQKPKSLLVVPLITNEQVFGVLEFAAFKKFNSSQVKFVQEISLIIARTIFNIKVNERTRNLLSESQTMSNELQLQQEVLRQNAEEMEATQEELKRSNYRLEEQIEEVNRTQKRMQLLLENASEVITIYEKDGTVRYISPSVQKILGYSQNELIGVKDIIHVNPEGVESVNSMFKELLEKPFESVTIQYSYNRKTGDNVWLEATGTNLLSDPAVQGIVVNSRDITERRRAEQEQRMRSQMQALSENSPDLITRLNQDGQFFYINPIIESYTGHNADHYLSKSLSEVELQPTITEQWLKILKDVNAQQSKITVEMDFPSILGDRVMQVNAIPEFNLDDAIESVLVVSHDITDRKLIELEVQTKNKKITESINYARRIQGAILPNNALINQVLPESFILYKAKDVVSGDFPWFMQIGDDIYIAAVDCTGHGVPGALISLIGYFLLNDIVRSRKISDPGIILDQLDEGVTQTLRQDRDDSKTKDGMDIALCKINLKKGEVEYAGAHRPLYFMNASGEMVEIKGNKFPIGGGIYKNQTNFTNTKLKVNKGDSIYFCSDGFPDQFGGPDNRKFGPQRLRGIINEHYKKDMSEVYEIMDSEWENWKGEGKQTDDVLLIGIKF